MLKEGYTAMVAVKQDRQKLRITKDTPVLFREEVKSKFVNGEPWYRIWYQINLKNDNQLKLNFPNEKKNNNLVM